MKKETYILKAKQQTAKNLVHLIEFYARKEMSSDFKEELIEEMVELIKDKVVPEQFLQSLSKHQAWVNTPSVQKELSKVLLFYEVNLNRFMYEMSNSEAIEPEFSVGDEVVFNKNKISCSGVICEVQNTLGMPMTYIILPDCGDIKIMVDWLDPTLRLQEPFDMTL